MREDLPAAINWMNWGGEALAAAREADRPLAVFALAACDHWAAQWLRELAADAEVCALLAEQYVCVAIDPADAPSLAARIQQILGLHGAQGWPAVAVAVPSGHFVGGVPYAPLRDADKRVGLARVLLDCAQVWTEASDDLRHDAAAIADILSQMAARSAEGSLPPLRLSLERIEAEAMHVADEIEGGFGPAPRFLQPGLLRFVLSRCASVPALRKQCEKTCDALLAGGVHDHLGGGFFHGATDQAWCRPFADKRLADNALAADLLLEAQAALGGERYRAAAEGAVGFVLQALLDKRGLAATGIHADSPGADGSPVEGAYYAWSDNAAAEVVGRKQADIFARRYLCDERSAIDGDAVFRIPALRGEVAEAERDQLPAICQRLLVARSERPAPALQAIYRADEQGMLLWALARLAAASDTDSTWHQGGQTVAAAIQRELSDADGGLLHSPGGVAATMADGAWCARGGLAWAAVVNDTALRDQALRWLAAAEAAGSDPSIDPPVALVCDSLEQPAPLAVLAAGCLDAHRASGEAAWRARAEAIVQGHAGVLRAAPQAASALAAVWAEL
ncbi:MAG: DUF255 domain-containing protein [Planctomycetota bacterium]|jgi:uncharacterized protein YyaL (SSP411 family)|nr:DUF255 domain-containing protein [Planctomycetota bacterium]